MPLAHFGLVVVICFAWGGNFLASAFALQHFPPYLFTTLRLVLLLAVLFPFLRPVARGQRWRLVAVAVLNGALHFGLNFWALKRAGDISSTAIALQCYIPMSALLAVWWLGERIRWRTAAGIALAFAGIVVLGFDPLVLDAIDALAMTLAAALALAIGTILMRGIKDIGMLEMQGWTALIGIPVLLAITFAIETDHWAAIATASWRDWAGVAYTALVASLVGHGLLYYLVQRHPVSEVTPYLLLAPVIAVALGVFVWGDTPGPKLMIGGAMVLGGVLIVALRAIARRREAPVVA